MIRTFRMKKKGKGITKEGNNVVKDTGTGKNMEL